MSGFPTRLEATCDGASRATLADVDAQAISALAADVLAATGLVLEDGQVLRRGRSDTLRYRVAGGGGDHEHVIVKRASDPGAATFRSEAAAMRVLGGCGTAAARVPRLLYDLSPRGVLVIEDASPAESLHGLLERAGEAERHAALLRVGHALGQLHGAARSVRARLDDRIDGATALERQAAALRKAVPEVQAFLQTAGVVAEPGLCDALERLAESIAADGPALTITVGDMAPTNMLLDAERVTFIDLEYSGVRHPFYDAAFWRCIYPLTPRTADAMEARYRVGLAQLGLPLDAATFEREMTRLCSHRVFWMLSWNMRALLEQSRPVVPGGPGLRSVLLHHLAELLRLAHRASHDAVLERTLERCSDALLQRWDARPADAAPGDTAVFHIVEASVWQAVTTLYRPASLAAEGFVHLSTASQLLDTAARFYAGKSDLLVLECDERELGPALRYEPPAGGAGEAEGSLFPHLHAPLPRDAVRRIGALVPRADGTFEWRRA